MEFTIAQQMISRATAGGQSVLSEIDSKRLLDAIGIAVAMPAAARSADEAAQAAARIGFPVVLKIVSADVSHKSDVGGVILNLATEGEVRDGFEQVRRQLAQRAPKARFDGVVVEAMARPGVELLAGITRDERFGPLVMAGIGGVFVEVLKDTVLRVAPVSERQARQMLAELRGAPLLYGARGAPAADVDAVAAMLARLSQLAAREPRIREVDLNPVVAYESGLMVLDARVLLGAPADGQAAPPDPYHERRLENLRRGFEARVAAVVGDKRKSGFFWLQTMAQFKGKLYSVQTDPREIPAIEAMGVENRKTLAEIREPIDFVLVSVPRAVTPQILKDCIDNRVRAVSFFTAGFSESGEETGVALEAQLREMALASDIALIGPNCIGLYCPEVGIRNCADQIVGKAGDVSFISQSGQHNTNFGLQAPGRGIRVKVCASIGNGTVLETADYLDVMAADPATRVIGLYIEGVRDGRHFFESLSRAAATRPVVVWRGGTSEVGSHAMFSHTASLATPTAVWSAVLKQSGAIEVRSFEALLDVVELLVHGREVRGRGMGLVATTGGQSVVITDAFASAGLEVPALSPSSYEELKKVFFNVVGTSYRNPFDSGLAVASFGSGIQPAKLRRILDVLDGDAAIDAIILELGMTLYGAGWISNEKELVALLDAVAEFNRASQKSFAIVLHPAHLEAFAVEAKQLARARGLVVFDSFDRAAAAFKAASDYYLGRAAARA